MTTESPSVSVSSWHSYPKVFAIGHAAVADLFLDDVLIEEKIDGSQFSFGRFGGELKCRSKGAQLDTLKPEKMFARAVEVASSLDLHDGWTYRAEYLQKPKHNTLAYDRTPDKHLALFDINSGQEQYLNYAAKIEEAERLQLEVVPCFPLSSVSEASTLLSLLDCPSFLGGQKVEGVVVKNYSRFTPDGKAMMGKFVSEAFKEIHGKDWKDRNPNRADIRESITASLRTPARWQKAVQHLTETGELEHSPRDIGLLIGEVRVDVQCECWDEIVKALFLWAWPQVRRGIVRGLPEWYKEKLLTDQFEEQGTEKL